MFSKLTGNDQIKHTLQHLVTKARVPNSLLFAGDEGIGKRQFALELARALLCPEPVSGAACGVCSACRRVGTFTFPKSDDKDAHRRVIFSSHPDVGTVIAFNRNILVDAIRHLETEANFRPFEARSRVFIIDDADKMNDAASNALLKTLEEPSPTTHIFLVTSRPDSLLPTIRSRCQILRFAPVKTDEIESFLIAERAFTLDEARLASRLSRGSIGRACAVNVADFRQRRERMLSVVENCVALHDRAALLKIAEEMNDAKNKDRFEDDLDALQSLIHDVWSRCAGAGIERIVNTDLSEEIEQLAHRSAGIDLPSWLAAIEKLRADLAVNINRKIAADALFVAMAGQAA